MGVSVASRTIAALAARNLLLMPARRGARSQAPLVMPRGPTRQKLSSIMLLEMVFSLMLAREATAPPTCLSSSPPTGIYRVNVCLTTPVNGDQLAGNQTFQGSVSVSGDNPGVRSLTFFLDAQHLITVFQSPYTFILPTETWGDGRHSLAIEATMRDGFQSHPMTTAVAFSNGITMAPINRDRFIPTRGTAPARGQPFILAATGDGAAGEMAAANVTNMIDSWHPNMFLYLGDVYANGSATEFLNWYAPDDYFGRFRDITNPTVGNHEYLTPNAQGYFDFWGNVPDFYSVDAAGWRLISLNSNRPTSWNAQLQWLSQDLQTNANPCTLVFFHHPLFSIGPQDGAFRPGMVAIWELLDEKGVDVVLTGHDHNYQRWKPLNGAGELDPNGVTQFVIGTGGHGVQRFTRTDHRVAASDATTGHQGALRMELNPDGASYQYITTAGTEDSGAIACDGADDATPPTAPTGLNATSSPRTSDTYQLQATDRGGNVPEPSNQATVTTPALRLHFRGAERRERPEQGRQVAATASDTASGTFYHPMFRYADQGRLTWRSR